MYLSISIKLDLEAIMKIIYDHQIFHSQKYGGISRYFYELYKEFNKESFKDITAEIYILSTENYYLKNSSFKNKINPTIPYFNKYTKRLSKYINLFYSNFTLKKRDYDIFHPTYYNKYFLKSIGDKPFVLTIHDMIHEIYAGKYFDQNDSTIIQKRILAKKANKIIAISKNTKSDIIKFYDIPEEKIKVIYHGYSNIAKENYKPLISNQYILYVGSRNGYKNFKLFLKSISDILLKNEQLILFCAGGGKFNESELDLINKLNINNSIIQKNVSDKELASLYSNAKAFIYPSLYEGFGIPILEAFNFGCPAIISDKSSFPEVAGEAVEYFNPTELNSIKNSIEKVVFNEYIRSEMIQKGYERLKKFNWKKTALETLKIYKNLK